MIEIDTLCNIALTLDKVIKSSDKDKKEIKETTLTIRVPRLTMLDIDKKLYMMENETDACYVPGDKVECTILGIRFCVLPEEQS